MSEPVKVLRELLNNPVWRFASGIPQDAEIDENALAELDSWHNEPIESLSFVSCLCACGWIGSFPSFSESPSTCPRCSANLVIRNQSNMDEIISPVVTTN